MIKYVARLHSNIVAAGVAITGVTSDGIVSPNNLQTLAQPIIDAFDDSDAAQLTADNIAARVAAENSLNTAKDLTAKLLRAVAAIAMDELNLHSTTETDMKAAVAAATSLANLQTRFAAITVTPQRTLAQIKTAIQNKLAGGTVD